jgi:hypothetical protein
MPENIRNNTPNELRIKGENESPIVLAPLETRVLEDDETKGFDLVKASQTGFITTWPAPKREQIENIIVYSFWTVIVIAIFLSVLAQKKPDAWSAEWVSWKAFVWIAGPLLCLLGLSAFATIKYKARRQVLRFMAQTLSLIVILTIGLGLPSATVYFFASGKILLADPSPKLFARCLQVGFIAVASLLPVLLFFLFDRFQLNTLRNRLYRDLFRLDRALRTRSEIDSKYGSQIQEAYGSEDEGQGRLARGTRWPVLVCAFVVTIGWLAAFMPVGELDTLSVHKPLLPMRSTLTFAFLGAYFFGLQLIARRYARGDLKPKAYSYIAIRILIAVILSWVLESFSGDSKILFLVAFLIGILPDEFFTLVKEKFRGKAIAKMVPDAEKHPLTRLEGIDLYERARLEQEGIVNVESFAHHDLINLVLETQIPVPRLVDWMDQAILYLHIIENETRDDGREPARDKLRQYGIRTATDLLRCWNAAHDRNELEAFKQLLGDSKPYRLAVVRDALLDDEWLERIQDWRKDDSREVVFINAPKKLDEKDKTASQPAASQDNGHKELAAKLTT